MIYVKTNANNAEKTIRRAIESVLNQSYTDFLYYINDNGSTDATKQLIQEYALKDTRIVPFYNKVNRVYEDEYIKHNFCELTEIIDDNDFLCYLDADDEYYPTFLEDILSFMEQYKLDIGCCGTYMLSESKNIIIGKRLLAADLILEGEDFSNLFPIYHQFARAVWGKVYKGFTLRERVLYDDPNDLTFPSYGSDTVQTLKAFSKAGKVGILAKTLHNYYFSEKSDSYRLDSKRVISDRLQHKITLEYLKKFGSVNQSNIEFLYVVYCNAIIDTIKVVIASNEQDKNKLNLLTDIFTNDITTEMLSSDGIDTNLKNEVIIQIYGWVKNSKIKISMKKSLIINIFNYKLSKLCNNYITNLVSVLLNNATVILDNIILGKLALALKLLNTTFKVLTERNREIKLLKIILMHKLNYDDSIIIEEYNDYFLKFSNIDYYDFIFNNFISLLQNNIILNNITMEFYIEYKVLIEKIIKKDYTEALQLMLKELSVDYINPSYALIFYILGQNISCIVDNQPFYLYFKKLTIDYLIDIESFNEAKRELNDLDILLPYDEDFKQFRKLLDS